MAGKHEQIAVSLINEILSGRYLPEDRLPSERELASRFDANRGAVREAMKKLEHLGLAEVQPGGARVQQRTEASLDALSHMLGQGPLPDMILVDQILVLINNLMSLAAEQTLQSANEEALQHIRDLTQPLLEETSDEHAHMLARFELMRAIMLSSNNLPLQMIAHSLTDQAIPSLSALAEYTNHDFKAHATFARQLDNALAAKDVDAVRACFDGLSNLNRETMMRAYETARSTTGQEAIQS